MKLIVLVATAMSLTMPLLAGSVYFASPDGTPGGDGSEERPYDIVTACSKLGDNTHDEVRLLPGTYKVGAANLAKVDYGAKLSGTGETAADVILDGEGAGNPIVAQYGAEIKNITFTNFSATAVSSVLTAYNTVGYSMLVVSNCVFTGIRGKYNACNVGGDGDLLVVDCLLYDNEAAATYGCAVNANNPKGKISRCMFADNRYTGGSAQGGGAICCLGGMTIDSCVISNNTATGYGGGLCLLSGGGTCVTNTFFYGNGSTASGGGGLYSAANAGKTNILVDCIFRANRTATKNVCGAGVRIGGDGLTVLKNCTFKDNQASGENGFGGAVYGGSSEAEALIEDCTFEGNRAIGSNGMGGACHFEMYGDGVVIQDCVFTNNISAGFGGAICARGPGADGRYLRLSVVDTIFTDNVATNSGGAFGQDYDANARIGYVGGFTNCVFRGNRSRNGGAFQGLGTTFSGCMFDANKTESLGGSAAGGGAIIVKSRGSDRACNPESTNSFAVIDCVFTNNSAAGVGAALSGEQETFYEFTDSTFVGNTTDSSAANACGGAVAIGVAVKNVAVDRCVFWCNSAKPTGGAFGVASASTPKMEMCTIRNSLFVANTNTSTYAGAVFMPQNCSVDNCTFVENFTMGDGGAIRASSLVNSTVRNCLFFGNRTKASADSSTCDISHGTFIKNNVTNCCSNLNYFQPSAGNLVTADPKFVDVASGDYRLADGSPCIDHGLNMGWMVDARDLQNNPKVARIIGDSVDIGCYEYRPKPGLILMVH